MNSYAGMDIIRNDILFKFLDEVDKDNNFVDTISDVIVGIDSNPMLDESGHHCRLVNVLAVGPDCDPMFTPGMTVIVHPLMWSYEFAHNGERLWKTDDTKIVGIVE